MAGLYLSDTCVLKLMLLGTMCLACTRNVPFVNVYPLLLVVCSCIVKITFNFVTRECLLNMVTHLFYVVQYTLLHIDAFGP